MAGTGECGSDRSPRSPLPTGEPSDAAGSLLSYSQKSSSPASSMLMKGGEDRAPVTGDITLPPDWVDQYELLPELLGSGAMGQILQIKEQSTSKMFAAKVMDWSFYVNRGMEHQLKSEVECLRRCADSACRHVVKFLGGAQDGTLVFLRMELCSRGSLLHIAMNRPSGHLDEAETMVWAKQLCIGMQDLHSVGILHRDMKPDNLLVTEDGTLKIADFGWAEDMRLNPTALAGTFQYMAPEVLTWEQHTEAVDVWSSGVTLTELLTGQVLISNPAQTGYSETDQNEADRLRIEELLRDMAEVCPPPHDMRPDHLTKCCWNLLRSMLRWSLEERITVPLALEHPWLRDIDLSGGVPKFREHTRKNVELPFKTPPKKTLEFVVPNEKKKDTAKRDSSPGDAVVLPAPSGKIAPVHVEKPIRPAAIAEGDYDAIVADFLQAVSKGARQRFTRRRESAATAKVKVVHRESPPTPVVNPPPEPVPAPSVAASSPVVPLRTPATQAHTAPGPALHKTPLPAPVVPFAAPAVTAPAVTATAITAPAITAPAMTAKGVVAPAVAAPAVTPPVAAPVVPAPAAASPTVAAPAVTAPAVSNPTVTTPAVGFPAVTNDVVTTPTVAPTVTTPAASVPVSGAKTTKPTESTPAHPQEVPAPVVPAPLVSAQAVPAAVLSPPTPPAETSADLPPAPVSESDASPTRSSKGPESPVLTGFVQGGSPREQREEPSWVPFNVPPRLTQGKPRCLGSMMSEPNTPVTPRILVFRSQRDEVGSPTALRRRWRPPEDAAAKLKWPSPSEVLSLSPATPRMKVQPPTWSPARRSDVSTAAPSEPGSPPWSPRSPGRSHWSSPSTPSPAEPQSPGPSFLPDCTILSTTLMARAVSLTPTPMNHHGSFRSLGTGTAAPQARAPSLSPAPVTHNGSFRHLGTAASQEGHRGPITSGSRSAHPVGSAVEDDWGQIRGSTGRRLIGSAEEFDSQSQGMCQNQTWSHPGSPRCVRREPRGLVKVASHTQPTLARGSAHLPRTPRGGLLANGEQRVGGCSETRASSPQPVRYPVPMNGTPSSPGRPPRLPPQVAALAREQLRGLS